MLRSARLLILRTITPSVLGSSPRSPGHGLGPLVCPSLFHRGTFPLRFRRVECSQHSLPGRGVSSSPPLSRNGAVPLWWRGCGGGGFRGGGLGFCALFPRVVRVGSF